jgi:adenosine deaminase
LADCLDKFNYVLPLLQKESALERVAFELVEDAWRDGVTYLEVRFCPILSYQEGLSGEQVVEAVLSGLRRATQKYKVPAGLILCVLQGMGEEIAESLADLAISYRNQGVLGLDVAGKEGGGFHIDPFVRAFARARDQGLRITVHAGEAGPGSNVRQAIERLGAQRVGHGTAILSDPRSIELAIAKGVGIECCLTSNVQTGAILKLEEHPLRQMLAAGLKVTLNTDNPTFSNTTISQEWAPAFDHLGLTESEAQAIRLNGFDLAFSQDALPQASTLKA